MKDTLGSTFASATADYSVSSQARAEQVAALFKAACMAELSALKPGNVHIFADGHGMTVQDFILSAEVTAAVIARPGLSVGQRILDATEASWAAVNCNTNLGIVLLAAPLIQAALQPGDQPLQARLQQVLRALTIDDAALTFRAIQRAAPGGLGKAEQHDVHEAAQITLLAAMQAAQARDLVARQYAHDYAEILGFATQCYQHALAKWQRPAWAVTALYMGLLAEYDDSHIQRKYGVEMAASIRQEARPHLLALLQCDNPKLYQRQLMQWDADLKRRNINPGTSADLTVATLFAISLDAKEEG